MKFLVITIFGLLSFSAFAGNLKVFSMNLHCGLGDWQARMETVVQEILEIDPDVIGLQEVCFNDDMNMTKTIIQKLEDGGYDVNFKLTTETHQSFIKYQEELLIISKHVVTNSLDESLPGIKFFENRILAIEINNIWFINTHLHFAFPQVRTRQYRKISRLFKDKNALLMGDLNSNSSDEESNLMKKDNWKDYYNGPTFPSHKPDKTFDGFWTTATLTSQIQKYEMKRLFLDEVNPPSDHLGILLEMDLK